MSENPRAIGVIMDGNRRWARAQGLPSFAGHEAGARKIEDLVSWARTAGIQEVTVYTFSTENWNRSEEEVAHLMTLFKRFIAESGKKLASQGARVRFIGERDRFTEELQRAMREIEEETEEGNITLILALSYGGRVEILHAVNALLTEGRREVSERDFTQALWTHNLQDPDLIIRTGGEQRLSNFLPWQSVYSELFFTETKWPDFSEGEFLEILETYHIRERRRGK